MTANTASDQILTKLRAVPMFTDLPEESAQALAAMVSYQRVPKGTFIITQGEVGSSMYLLVSGRVKVAIASPEGRELVLNYVESPAHFGEMALVDARPRSADVVAITEVELLVLEGHDLAAAIQLQPRLALSLIATLSRRLRQTISRLEDMAFHDATHRVARVVLNVATAGLETYGEAVVQGLTHYDIATLAGTSRETASRVISSLVRDGVVSTQGRRILVDIEALTDHLEQND